MPVRFVYAMSLLLLSARVFATCPGAPALPAAVEQWPRDQAIACVDAGTAKDQQYALYLPPDYRPDKRAPVLIVLDPRGRAEETLQMAIPAAREHGWIVMSSYQSRSDTLESVTIFALQALLDESDRRLAADPHRLYLAGMSGTAKTIWTVLPPLQGSLAGVIGCGGGRPPELGKLTVVPPAFFGCAGDQDFNYQEMRALDEALADAKATRRFEVFAGTHGWPPPSLFQLGMDWLQLMAMRGGQAPQRAEWILAQYVAAASAADAELDLLQRWRRWEQITRDFQGLHDTTLAQRQAADLRASAEFAAALAQERKLASDEKRYDAIVNAWVGRMLAKFVDGQAQAGMNAGQSLIELKIRSLTAQLDATDPRVALSARRRLERAWVAAAFYLPNAAAQQNQPQRAAVAREVARKIFPDHSPPPASD